jgi:hypothetical protein
LVLKGESPREMPPWLRRLFSKSFRDALAAEAAGDYVAAAERYALAGMPAKVAEMHFVRAGRVAAADRGNALEDALRWLRRVAEGVEVPPTLHESLARALVEEAKALPLGDPRRKNLAMEGAQLHEDGCRHREAGEAFELVGNTEEAARCYEAAGDIEGMERLLDEDCRAQETTSALNSDFEEYESMLGCGARDRAKAALLRCCATAPDQGYEQMLADLERRFPPPLTVEVRVDGVPFTVVGASPAFVGRGDAHIKLRHAGISRRHAAIDADDEGFYLRDAGSRNGTLLAGISIAGRVPLRGSGVIGLGDQCTLQYSVVGAAVDLEILDGPDRGTRAVVVRREWRAPGGAFVLTFRDGTAVVASAAPGPLCLNGVRVAEPVVALIGDTIDAPAGGRLEVRR